jgi:hypothetical protein
MNARHREVAELTPLAQAAAGGHADAIRQLLAAGADPNEVDDEICPVLHVAIGSGSLDAVKALVEGGADINLRGRADRFQPIGHALADERLEILRYLIASGADVNATDPFGVPVLMTALRAGKAEAARALLRAGAQPRDRHGKGIHDYVHERIPNFEAIRQMLNEEGLVYVEDPSPMAVTKRAIEAAAARIEGQPKGFAAALLDADYQRAVSFMANVFEGAGEPLELICGAEQLQGGWSYASPEEVVERLLEGHHKANLRRDRYLFRHVRGVGGQLGRVALLPTGDKFEVVTAMGTAGGNMDLSNADLVSWLRELDSANPYLLIGIGADFLEFRFEKALKAPKKWVASIAEICPDCIHQGIGSVEALAEHLKQNRDLFLWWD